MASSASKLMRNGLGQWAAFAIDRLSDGFEIRNHRRRGVDLEAVADLFAGERVAGGVGGRVRGDDLEPVAAIGNQRGVEAVGLVGDLVLEQAPDCFAVAAQIEGVDEVIAIVVVRSPADGHSGAVFVGLQRLVCAGVKGDCGTLAGRRERDVYGLG